MSEGHGINRGLRRSVMRDASRCALCGSYNMNNPTIDHIVPLSVIKWGGIQECDIKEFLKEFNCKSNMAAVCGKCNRLKGVNILTQSDIDSLFISDNQKKELKVFTEKHSDLINKYKHVFDTLYYKYNGVCQCGCRRRCSKAGVAIMRVDTDKNRCVDNGVIIRNNHCKKFRRLRKNYIK